MVYRLAVVVVLLLPITFHLTAGVTNPGFRAALTDKGLNYLQEIGIPLLKKELASISIPDISGRKSIKVGHVHYSVYHIELTNFNIGSSSLKTSPGRGLTLNIGDISLGVKADWKYKALGIHGHGSATASAGGTSLAISVLLGADATGHPTLTSTGCSFDTGHLHVKLHGGASWFYNLFDHNIASAIRKALNKKVCSIATASINTDANKELATLPIEVEVGRVLELNYALSQSPAFNDTFIMTFHKGEFLSVSNPTIEAPFSPPLLPPYSGSNKMMTMWLTDYIANTAILVYKRENYLAYNITSDMVSQIGIIKMVIPELNQKYPNNNLTIGVRAVEKPPFITITPGGANFTLPGAVDFYVVDRNSTLLAFTLGVMAYVDMKISIDIDPKTNYLKVSGNATNFVAHFTLLESNIGNIQVNKLQSIMDNLGRSIIIKQINKHANDGFPIPTMKGLRFINPTLTLGKGCVVVESDVSYGPSQY